MTRAIAIVGVAGVFPDAADERVLFDHVRHRRSAAREVPAARWPVPAADVVDADGGVDRARHARACLLDAAELEPGPELDAVPEALRARLSPLARLTVKVGTRAFASAGGLDAVDRDRIGVILANIALPTDGASRLAEALFLGPPLSAPADPLERYPSALPAGLLATALGLGGGSFTLDAACASSLYALYLACEELAAGRLDGVLAGGTSLPQCLYTQIGFTQLRALSPSGICSPFDTRADGLVVGEGAGIFVLRRLEDAVRDGASIRGVIRGLGLSNDIGGSLLSPDAEGQLRAARAAYADAGWSPDDVDLIECHGTGTPRGDAVELETLRALWSQTPVGRCVIGSVKSNVGHLLTAAGAAGLCKVLGAIEHGVLPPQANFSRQTQVPALREGPFRVLEAEEPWARRRPDLPRRAALSAFGFGGINAHLLVEEYVPARTHTQSSGKPGRAERVAIGAERVAIGAERVAIVGMGAHVGPLADRSAVQHALLSGRRVLEARPADRWLGLPGDALPGAWLDTFSLPLGRFRIPPRELAELLPQQLLMLKVAAEALDDLRVPLGPGPHHRAGAIVGLGLDLETTSFHLRWLVPGRARALAAALGVAPDELGAWATELRAALGPGLDATRTLGNLGGIVPSRLAREFQLGGPSFGVAGEEASGLRALELGARLLQQGQTDLMLIGAVDLAGDVRQAVASDALRRWSRTGRASAFDRDSDGPVLGEGAVALVLKRERDALRDGDRIYAVLDGVGAAGGPAAKSGEGRTETYRRAWAQALREARVHAGELSLIVAHGSGDPREDADELRALTRAQASEPTCALTTATAVLGDTGAASGLASVLLAALALHEEILPPLPGFTVAHDSPALQAAGLHVLRAPQVWLRDRARGPRRAGVASMSIDGTVASVVLQSAPEDVAASVGAGTSTGVKGSVAPSAAPLGPRPHALFVCRGDEAELAALSRAHGGPVERLAIHFHRERSGSGPVTRAFVATSREEIEAQLAAPPRGTPVSGAMAFVFPGSGNHYSGMGSRLGTQLPAVYRALDREVLHLRGHLMPAWSAPYSADWSPGWEARARSRWAAAPERVILSQVAHGLAVSDALRCFGLEPTTYLGYSLGESAGLFASRTWRDRDVMFERTLSSPLFTTELCGPSTVVQGAWGADAQWRVVVVNRGAAQVRERLVGTAALLIVNAPDECVVGGRREHVDATVEALGCGAIELENVPTVHLPVMAPVADAYRALHVLPCTPPAGVTFYSGAWGRAYTPTPDAAADSIVANALGGFDFPRTVEAAYDAGVRVFVEAGPQGSCTRMIGRILAGRPHLAVSACQRDQDGFRALLSCVAQLAEAQVGVELDWLYGREAGATWEAPSPRPAVTLAVAPPRPPRPAQPRGRAAAAQLGAPSLSAAPSFSAGASPSAPAAFSAPASRSPSRSSPAAPSRVGLPAHPGSRPAAGGEAPTRRELTLMTHSSTPHFSAATASAHEAFLRLADRNLQLQAEALLAQQALLAQLLELSPAADLGLAPDFTPALEPQARPPAFDYAACMTFAVGRLGDVLGAEFAFVDAHPTRVRLPAEPLMLCHRIKHVEGERGVLGPGRCVTEHDVVPGAWYLDAGRAPVCISVEAGQADLFLSAYLGIDRETKGLRVYRLLDAKIVFHRGLPRVGETIVYDIRIDRFIRQGDTWLFFFRFDGTIDGRPFITMYDGCAGFFSDEQLRSGRGIVTEPDHARPARRTLPSGEPTPEFTPLLPRATDLPADLEALRVGALGRAFGGPFRDRTLAPALRLPSGRMSLVDRIVELDTEGGPWGLGLVHGEADVRPDAWYLTCHFEGDPVMPGTLMYECCLHTLRVLLLRMGMLTEDAALDVRYEPVEGIASQLRCRGQVTPETRVVGYRIEIKERGYDPAPYVLANAAMFADGRHVVEMVSMSVRLAGLTQGDLERTWAAPAPVFTRAQILAYAEGDPSACFGERYRVFDRERRLARLPRPPFMFMDRVVRCEPPPFVLAPGGWIECELDVPEDAWYFAANRQRAMPFAVLLEAALQPCGFLAAYVGSALTSAEDLHFRNLDGHATCHAEVFAGQGSLTLRARLTKAAQAGGMLLEEFDLEIWSGTERVYSGHTGFGFFPAAALAEQVGVRGARLGPPPASPTQALAALAPLRPEDAVGPWSHGDLSLPARAFSMLDGFALDLEGGEFGLGLARGEKRVDPGEWFFQAHFYQDPVMPGSLGLETLLQLMKLLARERFPDLVETHRFQTMALGRAHRWQYRGQVIPTSGLVTVECVVTGLIPGDEPTLVARGQLAVDGRVIYGMTDFSLRLVRV